MGQRNQGEPGWAEAEKSAAGVVSIPNSLASNIDKNFKKNFWRIN
jgi:hypothetical protein